MKRSYRLLSTWFRYGFLSAERFIFPSRNPDLVEYSSFHLLLEQVSTMKQTLHLIPDGTRKWNKHQFENVHLFARWMLSTHVTILFPIKTFRKPLKILRDSSRKILWHNRWTAMPGYTRKKTEQTLRLLTWLETLSKHLRRLGGGGDGRAGVGLRPPPLGAKLEY